MSERSRFSTADFAVLATSMMWGVNFSVLKIGLASIDPVAFNGLRFAFSITIMLVVARLGRFSLRIGPGAWRPMLALGLLGSTVYQLVFIHGAALTSATNQALILATPPVFVALMGRLTGREHVSAGGWGGIALSFAGVAAIVIASDRSTELEFGGATIQGDVLLLLATVLWSLFTFWMRDITRRNGAVAATVWTTGLGCIPLVLLAIPEIASIDVDAVGWPTLSTTLLSAAIGIAIPYFLWNLGVRRLGSARTTLYSYLTPIFAVSVASVVLGERVTPGQALGGLLAIGGVVLARRGVRLVEADR